MTLPTKVDTTFNLQSFLQALVLAGGVIAWAMSVESRLSSLQSTQSAQARANERLEFKIDKLIDMHMSPGVK